MSFGITWPTNTADVINEIRDNIGRDITIKVLIDGTPCPICELDPITNTSTDSFCEVCSGVYWLNTTSGYVINAHVRWMGADTPLYTPGGAIYEGDCIATIEYTEENLQNVQNSDSFIIDEKDLYLEKYTMRGVPTINRIRLYLKEDSE